MKKSVTVPCSTVVSFFRGLYGRVAREMGLDASYISRVARGERESKAITKAVEREFNKGMALISARSHKNRNRKRERDHRIIS
jgi:hypothetical protein